MIAKVMLHQTVEGMDCTHTITIIYCNCIYMYSCMSELVPSCHKIAMSHNRHYISQYIVESLSTMYTTSDIPLV